MRNLHHVQNHVLQPALHPVPGLFEGVEVKREWKNGDLAIIRVPKKTAPGFNITADGNIDVPVVSSHGGWVALADPDYYWTKGYTFHAAAPRPLVVIDPEDREQVERLRKALIDSGAFVGLTKGNVSKVQAALREFANPTPPNPDEPQGLGAVVEDAAGYMWVRAPKDGNSVQTEWVSSHSTCQTWDAIAAFRVLSEGWSE